jgi:uncharacterized protein (TIGR03437 family)
MMKSLQTVCLLFASAGLVAAQQFTISTVAGIPNVSGWFGDGGAATGAYFYQPTRVFVDSKKNFYISDYFTHVVRMVTASTGNISTIAGNGTAGFGGDGAAGNLANITDVHGIAADGNGNVYISDTLNFRIRKIDSNGIITTFAGNGTRAYAGDGGTALAASLWYPGGLAIDGSGNLYVADYGSFTVRKIAADGSITTVAGTGTWGNSGDGGSATKATLAFPTSLTLDSAGNLYIGDVGNNNIRKIGKDGNISTVVSNVTPQGLGIDTAGNFYFVDGLSSSVRKILPGGGIVMIAGNGLPGYSGDGGTASLALLNQPAGLSMSPDGSIYVADTGNQIIRQLVPVSNSVGVEDAASSLAGPIAPGEILALFGSGLGPAVPVQFTLDANGRFPTSLAGTSVTMNGTPAPLIFTSSGVVAAIAPYEIANATTAAIVLTYQGKSFNATVPVVAAVPSMFTADTSGAGLAAALNQDLSVNSLTNPAKAGSTIVLYATGEGLTNAPVNGKPADPTCGVACLPVPLLQPVRVKVGNQLVTASFAGGSPTLVAGIMQVNVVIPPATPTGPTQVQLLVAGFQSQPGVTIAVTQ